VAADLKSAMSAVLFVTRSLQIDRHITADPRTVTYYTITVDTEEEWDWSGSFPVTDLALTNIAALPRFQDMCSRFGASVTYFTDQAVFENEQARSILLGIAGRDDVEIGMHIHPWNTPPLNGPVTPRETFLHNLPPSTALAKLNSVYECFEKCGLKPTSFRGGRYSSGGAIHEFLRDKGFLADASVVPFTTWADDGAPDYRRRGLKPERLPPRSAAEPPLWEIPLTLAFTRRPYALWAKFYNVVSHSWLGKLRLIGIAERLGIVRKAWLSFEDPMGRDMPSFLRKLRRLNLPCICFSVHSSSFVAGKALYTPTKADEDRLFNQVEEVLQTLSNWPEFQPATVTQVAQKLEEDHHACSRN
jgi:hypothetical protein